LADGQGHRGCTERGYGIIDVITGLDQVIHAFSALTEAALGAWTAGSSLI